MSDHLYLDSTHRDRSQYPNPADFSVPPNQMAGFYKQPRSVRAIPAPQPAPLIYAWSIRPVSVVTPYTIAAQSLPHLYMIFKGNYNKSNNLVASIGSKYSEFTFVLDQQGIQFDSANAPIWIKWGCYMDPQVMRFKKDDVVNFKLCIDADGTPYENGDALIPANPLPLKQITALFSLTPYIRDGEFANQLAGMIASS